MNFEKEPKFHPESEAEEKKDVLEEAIEGRGKTMEDFEKQREEEEEQRKESHPEEFSDEEKEA